MAALYCLQLVLTTKDWERSKSLDKLIATLQELV